MLNECFVGTKFDTRFQRAVKWLFMQSLLLSTLHFGSAGMMMMANWHEIGFRREWRYAKLAALNVIMGQYFVPLLVRESKLKRMASLQCLFEESIIEIGWFFWDFQFTSLDTVSFFRLLEESFFEWVNESRQHFIVDSEAIFSTRIRFATWNQNLQIRTISKTAISTQSYISCKIS